MKTKLLNISLLYVEDDNDTRVALSEVFKKKVKKLYVAKDGVEALELFKQHNIHIVISDLMMPEMDGNELCSEIKKLNYLVHFILLTAFNDSKLLVNAIDSGVDKFLQKPVNAKKLFSIMDETYEKIIDRFEMEKSTVCVKEAEKIANLSYWHVNLTTKEISFSQEAKTLFNLNNEQDLKVNYKRFSDSVKKEDKAKFLEVFEKLVFEKKEIDEVVSIEGVDNKIFYIHIAAKKWKSSACGSNHITGLFQDVSSYELQKSELLKQSQSDPMLNISNKKFLMYELENLIKLSKRYGHPIGVIFFDIDDFKCINDICGHLVADKILIELSNLVKNSIRQSDYFGRWGGDEFVIVTGYSSPESTIQLARKLLDKIENYKWIEETALTISIGISSYEAGDDVNTLLNRADEKMFEAKKLGKNRYSY